MKMMTALPSLAALVVLAQACSDESDSLIWLSMPTEGAKSEIIAVSVRDEVRVTGYDLDTFPIELGDVDPSVPIRVEALAYGAKLSELGLAPGPLTRNPDGKLLPDGLGLFVSEIREGRSNPWGPLSRERSVLGEFRTGVGGPCPDFRVEPRTLSGSDADANFAVTLPGGVVWVGMSDGKLFEVGLDDVHPVETGTSGFGLTAGAISQEGKVVFGTDHGVLLQVDAFGPPLVLTELGRLANGAEIQAIAQDFEGNWVVNTSLGRVLRFVGTSRVVLHDYAITNPTPRSAGLMRTSDRLLAFSEASAQIVSITSTTATLFEVPGSQAGFTAGAFVEAVGPVVITAEARIFVLSNPPREVLGSPIHVYQDAIFPYGSGFLIGAAFGNVGVYVPEVAGGFCPVEQLVAFGIYAIARLGSGWVVAGAGTGTEAAIAVLR